MVRVDGQLRPTMRTDASTGRPGDQPASPGFLVRPWRFPIAGLAAIVATVWGLCFVLIQASLPSPAPLLMAGLRAVIGGAVLGSWVLLRRRPVPDGVTSGGSIGERRPRWGLPSAPVIIVLALTNAALAFGAMYLAAGRAEAAVASILAGGQPLVLAAAGCALFGERMSVRTALAASVAMAGVVLVATASSGATSAEGIALSLLATAAPAGGTIVMRRLGSGIDLVGTTCAQFLLGGLALLGVSAVLEPWGSVSWSPTAVVGLLLLGVVGTGVAYVAWFWLLGRTSLQQLGMALFLVPVVGVVSGILAGDRPGPVVLGGIVALLVGIGLSSAGRSSDAAAPATSRA